MKLYRSIATVSGFTAISRVLGFTRDMMIAAVIGAGSISDAFFVAFRLPNLFRSLFAEGAFNAAFVPLMTRRLQEGGFEAARRFAEEALAMLIFLLLVASIAAEIAMPWLVTLIAPGFVDDPQKFDLAVLLTRITFPYLFCMSLTALSAGILNVMGRFAAAAAAPIILNIVAISAMIIAASLGMHNRPEAAIILAWAVAFSGFAQLAVLAYMAWRNGMDLGFRLPRITPGVRRLFRLAGPGILTAGITQINLLIGTMIASLAHGAVSYIYYADRINQLPLGLVGIAIGVVLLPELSQRLASGDDKAAMRSHNRALEFALLLTLPSAAALCVIPTPIIQVLFERGAFTATDTHAVSTALTAFACGLPAFVMIKVFQPGFFAREDTRTPMIYAGISAVVNITGSFSMFFVLGHVGIAIATSLAAWTNATLLGTTLIRRGDFVADELLRKRGAMILVSSVVMAAALWIANMPLASLFAPANGALTRISALALLIGGGALVYLLIAQLTGALSAKTLWRSLKRG
ncbi:MAG TPA: murein biosynthesis integral membrane protein MurJ [Hyphomicrobiales bacterium]|nr:murein biosynthesis integral membrane protein MurJ [Hyphomicrobiales bacterium]